MRKIRELVKEKFKRSSDTQTEPIICPGSPKHAGNGNIHDKGGAAAPGAPAGAGSRCSTPCAAGSPKHRCWLCAVPIKDIEPQELLLCFRCLHIAFLEIIMPLINRPERRRADIDFISKISKMKDSEECGPLGPEVPKVCSPHLPPVCDAPHPGNVSPSGCSASRDESGLDDRRRTGKGAWTHQRCLTAGERGSCAASDCGQSAVECPICHVACNPNDTRLTRCLKDVVHIVWVCSGCGLTNTQNGNECHGCRAPFTWSCLHCGFRQDSPCTRDGLRTCNKCEALNTPVDVLESLNRAHSREGQAQAAVCDSAGPNNEGNDTAVAEVEFGVNDPDTIAEQARQREIMEGRARLRKRMRWLGVETNSQESDGNCMFRALAAQLLGEPDAHMTIRRLVVGYMKSRSDSYKILFDGEEEWANYLSKMFCSGSWGDELCLNAASRCFRVNIHVITSAPSGWHLVFQFEDLRCSTTSSHGDASGSKFLEVPRSLSLFLSYIAPVHYDDVSVHHTQVISLNAKVTDRLNLMLAEEVRLCKPKGETMNGGAGGGEFFPKTAVMEKAAATCHKGEGHRQRCREQNNQVDGRCLPQVSREREQGMSERKSRQASAYQRRIGDEFPPHVSSQPQRQGREELQWLVEGRQLPQVSGERQRSANRLCSRPVSGHHPFRGNIGSSRHGSPQQQRRIGGEFPRHFSDQPQRQGRDELQWLVEGRQLPQVSGERQRSANRLCSRPVSGRCQRRLMGEFPQQAKGHQHLREDDGQKLQVDEGRRCIGNQDSRGPVGGPHQLQANKFSSRPVSGHPQRLFNEEIMRRVNGQYHPRTDEEPSDAMDGSGLWRMVPRLLPQDDEAYHSGYHRDQQPRGHKFQRQPDNAHNPPTPRQQSRHWAQTRPTVDRSYENSAPEISRPTTMGHISGMTSPSFSSDPRLGGMSFPSKHNSPKWAPRTSRNLR